MRINAITIPNYKAPQKQITEKNYPYDSVSFGKTVSVAKNTHSALPYFSEIIAKFNDKFSKPDTKNGRIGYTKQGSTGDCWILSSVNALSYCKKGRQIIKNALNYEKGGTRVDLKGAKSYWISDLELHKTKGSLQYASGDDDMTLFELALQRARDDLATENIVFTENAPSNIEDECSEKLTKLFKPSIDGGSEIEALYFITGKTPKAVESYRKRDELLGKFIEDKGQNYAVCAAFSDDKNVTCKDIQGKRVKLYSKHTYALKKADNESVTVVNPYNSAINTVLATDDFLKIFKSMYFVDCSDENPNIKYIDTTKKTKQINEDGSLTVSVYRNSNSRLYCKEEYDSKKNLVFRTYYNDDSTIDSKTKFYPNGDLNYINYYDYHSDKSLKSSNKIYYRNNKKSYSFEYGYDKQCQRTYIYKRHYEKGIISREEYRFYGKNGEIEYKELTLFNKDGNPKSKTRIA